MASRSTQRSLGPAGWPAGQGWTSRLGQWLGSGLRQSWAEVPVRRGSSGRRAEAVATARLEFAEALFDVHTLGAADALDRIAVCRSLPELWHLREAVFSLIARRHDQAEASRRVAELDAHFGRGNGHASRPPPHPLHDGLA